MSSILTLVTFFGPIVVDRLLDQAFGRNWTQKLSVIVGSDVTPRLTTGERRKLSSGLSAGGWNALVQYSRGVEDPLLRIVATAIGADDSARSASTAESLFANVTRSLEPVDRDVWISSRLDEIRRQMFTDANSGGALSEQLGVPEYRLNIAALARWHRWRRRKAAGLSDDAVAASMQLDLAGLADVESAKVGRVSFLVGAVGSGKSDVTLQWLARSADSRQVDHPLPVWIRGDSIGENFESRVLGQVSARHLTRYGADVLVDGLDESGERSSSLADQAVEFAARWPLCRIVVSTRIGEIPLGGEKLEIRPLTDPEIVDPKDTNPSGLKHEQYYPFGDKDWSAAMGMRNGVESVNRNLKRGQHEDLANPDHRAVRGNTYTYLVGALSAVVENLRQILSFYKRQLATKTLTRRTIRFRLFSGKATALSIKRTPASILRAN